MSDHWEFSEEDLAEMAEYMDCSIEEVRAEYGLPTNDPKWKTSEWAPTQTKEAAKVKNRRVEMAEILVMPDARTAWQTVMEGTADARCAFRAEHVHNVFRALGINPNAPWPPSSDPLMLLLTPAKEVTDAAE